MEVLALPDGRSRFVWAKGWFHRSALSVEWGGRGEVCVRRRCPQVHGYLLPWWSPAPCRADISAAGDNRRLRLAWVREP